MRTIQIGTELPSGEFFLKYNSAMTFDMTFWEDAAATQPSDLTGAVITLEITNEGTTTTFTASNSTNSAVWTLTAAQTNVDWHEATFVVAFTKLSERETVLSGVVRIQR